MFNTGIIVRLKAMWNSVLPSSARPSEAYPDARPFSNEQYWSRQNVTAHRRFGNARQSLAYFHWRNDNYYDYLRFMPVSGHDGKAVLDYGCGPGNDLVGFASYSQPNRLIGADIAQPSLDEAAERLALHGHKAEFLKINDDNPQIPLENHSVDYIHCTGVLMYVADVLGTLQEFRRLLRPGGTARVMVYNYDSVWFHLFAGYLQRFENPAFQRTNKTTEEVFFESTDWSSCPRNRVWTAGDFMALCEKAGFSCEHLGNAVAVREMEILPKRFTAVLDERLEEVHRRFLLGLTFDARGVPYFNGHAAGIDACFLLRPQ
jgi:ubiquinone/menaquinone biosynthesis C-methylase UbiE